MQNLESLFNLTGRYAVVVGAGGAIGGAVAQGLAAFGAHTVCVDLDEAAARRTAKFIVEGGGSAAAGQVDIVSKDDVDRLAHENEAADILVITAAVGMRKTLVETTEESFDRLVSVNLKGAFFLTSAFGRAMAARGAGSIIAYTSVRASVVEAGTGVYSATKAGVMQMMKTLAAELGPRGVRVNMIAPSTVETPMTADYQGDPEVYQATANRSFLRRWAKPEDMIGPTLLLASDAGAFMTGTQLFVDGGWTASDGMSRFKFE